MATIHLCDAEKGGVGKSWLTTTMAQYFIDRGWLFYLVACDRSNPTAAKRYRDKERYRSFMKQSVKYVIFSESEKKVDSPDVIFDWAIEKPVIVDLPAQVHRPMADWIDQKRVIELGREHGVKLIKWFVCDGEDDAINLFLKSIAHYENRIPHVLIKNWGRCEDWEYFEEHAELQSAIKEYGVKVIEFPKLSDGKRIKMNARKWTFEEAIDSGEFPTLGVQDFHNYLKKAYAAFDSTGLLP